MVSAREDGSALPNDGALTEDTVRENGSKTG